MNIVNHYFNSIKTI